LRTSVLHQSTPATTALAPIKFEGARVARSAFNAKHRTLSVSGSWIENISMTGIAGPRRRSDGTTLDLSGHIILPGLINAHDHLDFSIFPRLGRGPYPSWREWGADIHRSEQSSINECLRVPLEIRLWWGGIRNLISGVTTVSHHNPFHHHVFRDRFPVHVPHDYCWAHSLGEARSVVERFHQTPPDWPFVLHLAEGTDEASHRELDVLEHLVTLHDRLLLVHCVGMTQKQWERVARSGAGIVWCPSSNLYTLGQTLTSDRVSNFPNIALGTDSPLSAEGDLLDEIRLAHGQLGVPAPNLYDLVTSQTARLLRLKRGEGDLQSGFKADLIVSCDRGLTPAETLVQLSWRDIDLVMENGRLTLLSASLAERVPYALRTGMESIFVDGVERLVRVPVRQLWHETSMHLGRPPAIGGREITLKETMELPNYKSMHLPQSAVSGRLEGSRLA